MKRMVTMAAGVSISTAIVNSWKWNCGNNEQLLLTFAVVNNAKNGRTEKRENESVPQKAYVRQVQKFKTLRHNENEFTRASPLKKISP